YVDLGTWNPSAATGQLTVALWANWNGLSGQYQGLIAKRDVWATDDMMWQIEANRDTGTLGFFRNGSNPADGDPILPVGEWAHVAATFDGTTAKFYFNAEMTGQGDFSFGSDPAAALVFGACQGDGGNPFNGALDEVRIYDRALTAFEINHLAGK
ncbi:MAG: LamG domain-containing protein, partial [Phycisphaerales bacterium]